MPATIPDGRRLFLRRVAAFLVDVALLFAVLAPLGYVLQGVLGVRPQTARGIYASLVVGFSFPAWAYFAIADSSRGGATIGKRLLSLCTVRKVGGRLGLGPAIGRTAIKMLPWETAHAAAFLFAPALGVFETPSWIGLGISYTLSFAYLALAWRTGGRRSVHDLIVGTRVERAC